MTTRAYREVNPPPGIRIAYGSAPEQFGELRLPAGTGPHPVVVVIHGGWWRAIHDLGYCGHMAAACAADGYASWNIEYRRVGSPGGGYPGTLQDVTAAVAALASFAGEHALDLTRIVVIGHSAGGQLAAWLAAKQAHRELDTFGEAPPVAGAVAIAGALDLVRCSERGIGSNGVPVHDFLEGSSSEVPQRYALSSPVALLPAGVRVIAVHGTADANVPHELSEIYVEQARRAGDEARLVLLEDVDHFEIMNPAAPAGEAVREAVRSLIAVASR